MLALTMGDPAGIGGGLTVSAWQALRHGGPAFAAIDDPARFAGIPVRAVQTLAEAATVFPEALPVLSQPLAAPAVPVGMACRLCLGARPPREQLWRALSFPQR